MPSDADLYTKHMTFHRGHFIHWSVTFSYHFNIIQSQIESLNKFSVKLTWNRRPLTMCLWHGTNAFDPFNISCMITFVWSPYKHLDNVSPHAKENTLLHWFISQQYDHTDDRAKNDTNTLTSPGFSFFFHNQNWTTFSMIVFWVCSREWFADFKEKWWHTKGRRGGVEEEEMRGGFRSLWAFSSALEIFEVRRPKLHLCKFYRVLMALPVEPVDPLWKKGEGKSWEEASGCITVKFL